MTYPIKGYPWRRNPVPAYECWLTPEKANRITRHIRTRKLCYALAIYQAPGEALVSFSMEEALRSAAIQRSPQDRRQVHSLKNAQKPQKCIYFESFVVVAIHL